MHVKCNVAPNLTYIYVNLLATFTSILYNLRIAQYSAHCSVQCALLSTVHIETAKNGRLDNKLV